MSHDTPPENEAGLFYNASEPTLDVQCITTFVGLILICCYDIKFVSVHTDTLYINKITKVT